MNGYSQPVDIFVPATFDTRAPFALAYHFMGYWTKPAYNPFTATNGDYGSYLAAANKNAILILPESTGSDSTYAKDLNTAAKLNSFFHAIDAVLQNGGVRADDSTPLLLTGHSGAYVELGLIGTWAASHAVPALVSVRGFALFDCGYGYRAGLAQILSVMRANGHAAYFSAYNPVNSSGKKSTMQRLERDLGCSSDVKFVENTNITHMSFMKNYMTEFFEFAL